MRTELYRLCWNLNSKEYRRNIHKLYATETDKTYKNFEGNCGWVTVLKKSKLCEINSGILQTERLDGFTYEVFVLEKDVEHFKKELDLKIKESFNKHYNNFKKMEQNL